ncbi:MAG: hypothetical protein EOQ89_04865 [Mesorhizobium sp.]|nr:MAG: hypothetical protein EOQ87_04315 [Mesorhizobium sp.]RWI05314.1 MAG: hypothetical protein EOQ89_04865 [Mesorhizobium sp.]
MPAVMQMALASYGSSPVVQRVTTGGAARTTSTVLAWAAATAGNLIVIEFICEMNAAAPTTPAGYSLWPSGNFVGGTWTTSIFYKIAAGGETGVTITHGNNVTCSAMREFGNTSGTIDFVAPATGTSVNPDPPSLTPAGGAKNYLWIAGASYITTSVNAFSSGYLNGVTGASTSPGYLTRVSSAERETEAAAVENPGALTLAASSAWVAYTYAVSPA